ncbi:hypothetical protein [Thioflexithrix psekupsensis]|uniref:Uncharacterized protein n=1 Tax=Thioflexithrix psekupsensis TaxID=1570016 RepID=A0A251X615_9GAMM|nr:hypothetical protein [Thioflexithrix psekupsensis]OUD13078.1 hypothetical protein TPSD3_10535 [Thioflexithrix psekupsensis]
MLKQAGLGAFDQQQVLIELAENSHLAAVFGEQGKPRFGIAGLLRLSGRLDSLVQTFKNVPSPLVLAPRPAMPAAMLNSAVGLLASTPAPYETATLLIHVEDAPLFAGCYAQVNEFSVLWDVLDPPSPALVAMAQTLADQQVITQHTWRGFHLYRHPNRNSPDAVDRMQQFKTILQDYPLLTGQAA